MYSNSTGTLQECVNDLKAILIYSNLCCLAHLFVFRLLEEREMQKETISTYFMSPFCFSRFDNIKRTDYTCAVYV